MSNVYIVNKSSHDFSAARRYGEIVFLSEGPMNRYETNNMMRMFKEVMKNSGPSDYIVLCSLNVMNSIACAIFSHLHGRLNLLLFKDGTYEPREHVL
jgi:hypothetical protein